MVRYTTNIFSTQRGLINIVNLLIINLLPASSHMEQHECFFLSHTHELQSIVNKIVHIWYHDCGVGIDEFNSFSFSVSRCFYCHTIIVVIVVVVSLKHQSVNINFLLILTWESEVIYRNKNI